MARPDDDHATRRRSAFELLLGLSILGVMLAIGGFLVMERSGIEQTISSFEETFERIGPLERGEGPGVLVDTAMPGPVEIPQGEYLVVDLGPIRATRDAAEAAPPAEDSDEPPFRVSIRRAADGDAAGTPIAVEPTSGGVQARILHGFPLLGFTEIPTDGRYLVTPEPRDPSQPAASLRATTIALVPSTRDEFERSRSFLRSMVMAVFGACGVIVGPIVAVACGIPALVVRLRDASAKRRTA
ncbi:MAG: hypothetical protein GC172_10475 [Phycisphaera sp.]|nr:hypothetical protein [Phycisphaera sp.]